VSQENVEVVVASIDAYNAEDLSAQMATYAPDAIVVPDPDSALAFLGDFDRSVGREALRTSVEAVRDHWGGRYKASEVRAVDEHRVLCRGKLGGVGAASEIELYESMSVLFTVRDGLITRAEFFSDHARALKAAGLKE
jgi:ketosteroid isomerase-like protein